MMGGDRTTAKTIIDRYALASSATVTDHGDLAAAYHSPASASSLTHAYVAGNGATNGKAIQKVQMSSASNGTSVGDLNVGAGTSAGCFQ